MEILLLVVENGKKFKNKYILFIIKYKLSYSIYHDFKKNIIYKNNIFNK